MTCAWRCSVSRTASWSDGTNTWLCARWSLASSRHASLDTATSCSASSRPTGPSCRSSSSPSRAAATAPARWQTRGGRWSSPWRLTARGASTGRCGSTRWHEAGWGAHHLGRERGARMGLPHGARPRARRDAPAGLDRDGAGSAGLPARGCRGDALCAGRRRPSTRRRFPRRRAARARPKASRPGRRGQRGSDPISRAAWIALAESLDAAGEIASERGLQLAFHPHAGTAVEKSEEVSTLLEMTNVALCLDTGHLFLGGADPAQVARDAGTRVRHVHLKDVDAGLAARVQSGDLPYAAAVRAGLYRPLGQGDLDVRAVLDELRRAGYDGWYVLEQDTALDASPAPAEGPVRSARQSLEFFRELHGVEQRKQEETA